MLAVSFYYPCSIDDEDRSEPEPDSLPSTLFFLVELNYDEQISLLKSLVRARDPSFSGIVMILCDLALLRL